MRQCQIRSVAGRWHGGPALVLLALLVLPTGAGAEPTSASESFKVPASAGQQSPSSEVRDAAGNQSAASTAAGPAAANTALARAVCLKEGEACNPLNDLCCPGYYCPGGLARTCAPKP